MTTTQQEGTDLPAREAFGHPPAAASDTMAPGRMNIPAILAVGGTMLSIATFFVPGWLTFLGTIVLGKSLVVLGLSILWRAGLVSFGQALFFGIGAYTVGLAGFYFKLTDFILLVAVAGGGALASAFLLGFLLARYRNIFFAKLNLAFSMLLYGVLVKNEALGSTDGLHAPTPTFFGFAAPQGLQLPLTFTASMLVVVAMFVLADRFLQSTLGKMTVAIRENEIRVEYLGYSPRRAVHCYVCIAAFLAGLGGAIIAFAVGHVDPGQVYWTTSGEFVFITVLAGTTHVMAPLLGTVVFEIIKSFASQYSPETWQLVLGGSLLMCMLFMPNGLWSLFTGKRKGSGGSRK